MKEFVVDFINRNHENNKVIFVLKGFSVSDIGVDSVNIQETIDNKIQRIVSISQQSKAIISYEEFVCLFDFIIAQFKRVFILENNIYLNLFPLNAIVAPEISDSLLNHFNEDCDEERLIGDLTEYTNIFSNYILSEDGIACCYNISDELLKNPKIERVTFGSIGEELDKVSVLLNNVEYINLCTELDYYQVAQRVYYHNASFAVAWDNFSSGKETIHKKLRILGHYRQGSIVTYRSNGSLQTPKVNKDLYKYLKQYWDFTEFMELPFYDLDILEGSEKSVIQISQEQIICDLIEQVENCIHGKNFRDVFVTAPTGSGKSLMFQLPAMLLAEKYGLLTIVITPLIGLMNDQIQELKKRGYSYARTINSDIPPIIKNEISEEISRGDCHILYISPETLLSRSDIAQLIGKRNIGMLVVDEAHIVTTWGKQFRPDYWYLGDHVQKLRKTQAKAEINPSPFIIATFTATAIYEGTEDMFHETINSLHMIDPITYLGHIRRKNIAIEVSEVEVKRNKVEYEINKFDALIEMINIALIRNQKVLIYFPTVALISRFHDYCYSKKLSEYISKYHGQMDAGSREESFRAFLNGDRKIMVATKAFGMGINIPDISIVSHFAPTGNVCDYMQEIGRAARRPSISGQAIYKHMSNDFKHMNKLHGLSAIRKHQLIEVIKKILELYTQNQYNKRNSPMTKKRNAMLVDAESFAYIFDSSLTDENELVNKVKTAMLLIQKDYENRGFAPFHMRPIPLFAYGFFSITPSEQNKLNSRFTNSVKLIYNPRNVCEVNLKSIWESNYQSEMSFPKFKYLLYTQSPELKFNQMFSLKPAMSVEIYFEQNGEQIYRDEIEALKSIIYNSATQNKYVSLKEMIIDLKARCNINSFRAESIIDVFIAAIDVYKREYTTRLNVRMYSSRSTRDGNISYQFTNSMREFFSWLAREYKYIEDNTKGNKLYIVDEDNQSQRKQLTTALGVLESLGVLRFKSLGGSNSQIYIYVNDSKGMRIVSDRPNLYKNKLLDLINKRHSDSVRMLTYLFQSGFGSDQIWEHLENYFLGILPQELIGKIETKAVDNEEMIVLLQIGESLSEDYSDWNEANNALFQNKEIGKFAGKEIPMADYYAAKLIAGNHEIEAQLAWATPKVVITSGEEDHTLRAMVGNQGWVCVPLESLDAESLKTILRR